VTSVLVGQTPVDVDQVLIELDRAECAESLAAFIRHAWPILEPETPYTHGWHIDAMCEHLEAITWDEEGRKFLANVPPGSMKSLLVGVLWPSWEWGPQNRPGLRYVCAAHTQDLAIRDSRKMRLLIASDWYQQRWPHVQLTKRGDIKFENTAMGVRQAVAFTGITGYRGNRVIIDDPHSVDGAESEVQREHAVRLFRESVSSRVNDAKTDSIIVIMQRLHEDDVSGMILDKALGYDHLMIPMRYDPTRASSTWLGWEDPRTEPGELMFPEKFPEYVVQSKEREMGQYATAAQYQQEPAPRGGGVIKREWWQLHTERTYPPMDFIVASLDTAYTEKTENDFSALTVWGVFSGASVAWANKWATPGSRLMDKGDNAALFEEALQVRTKTPQGGGDMPCAMLMMAWAERLELHALVLKVADTCRKMKVDRLLIEDKASGHSVAQELRRLFGYEDWAVQLVNPGRVDKLARLHSVSHLFAEGMIYAPDKAWADMVIQQVSVFPKGKHDDLADTVSQALRHLRDAGMMTRAPEWASEAADSMRSIGGDPPPSYPG